MSLVVDVMDSSDSTLNYHNNTDMVGGMGVDSKRQTNLSSFFRKTEARTIPEAIVIDRSPEPAPKRRRLSSDLLDNEGKEKETFMVDYDYPPPRHPSYRLPPSPTFNHPFKIGPIPDSLLAKLWFNEVPRPIVNTSLGLDLVYFKRFIDPSCSVELTKYLLSALPWYRVKYTVRGISINTPRFTTVFGKDSTNTPWTGYDKSSPRAIPRILLIIMQKVEQVTAETYNFALVNYYSTGVDSISYHSDSESFLGPNPCIASISLGASRDFKLRHINYKTNKAPIETFSLADGDMVVMRGRTQHDWQHSIPKRTRSEGRINITFRKGIVKYATQNYNQYNVGTGPVYRWDSGHMVENGANVS